MKKQMLMFLPVVVLLTSVLALYAAAQGVVDPPHGGPTHEGPTRDRITHEGIMAIGDSTVHSVSPAMLPPGTAFDLCFTVWVDSPDQEYMDLFDVDLPDNWTVHSVAADSVPVANGCDDALPPVSGLGAGNVVYWQSAGYPTTCGAWIHGVYDFCANVTIPDCSGAPWSLPWYIFGDGYGDPPHEASGTTDPLHCGVASLDLTPDTMAVEGCHTEVQTHTLNLANNTGVDGTFSLTYRVPSGNGSLSGPDAIYLGHGVNQDMIVELTPDACLPEGTQVIATIAASGGGYNDFSTITKTIRHWNTCPTCLAVYLPVVLRNH